MEKLNVDGVVLKTSPTAEADLILFILTRNKGIIRAFSKGARSAKSRLHAGSVQFAYCEFCLTEKRGVYYVEAADVKDIFFELREQLETLVPAQYFCEVLLKTVPEDMCEPEYLRLMLNCLHLLAKHKKPPKLIKAVFELRLVSLSGYMPSLVGCAHCGVFATDTMYFDCQAGQLFCADCPDSNLPQVPVGIISAMRHIVYSEFEKCFSFELPQEQLSILARLTGVYTENVFHRRFRLPDYLDLL